MTALSEALASILLNHVKSHCGWSPYQPGSTATDIERPVQPLACEHLSNPSGTLRCCNDIHFDQELAFCGMDKHQFAKIKSKAGNNGSKEKWKELANKKQQDSSLRSILPEAVAREFKFRKSAFHCGKSVEREHLAVSDTPHLGVSWKDSAAQAHSCGFWNSENELVRKSNAAVDRRLAARNKGFLMCPPRRQTRLSEKPSQILPQGRGGLRTETLAGVSPVII